MIHNLAVAEDGAVVRAIPGLDAWTVARPIGPHLYAAGDRRIDTATGAVTAQPPPVTFIQAGEHSTLTRFGPSGAAAWQVTLAGVRSVRPPDVVVGSGRVIATIDTTMHAFDDATGKEVWTANIEGDSLVIAGDLVLSTMCNEPTKDHWLIGTALADGKERFRAPLSLGCDPAIQVTDRFVFVVDEHAPKTRVFDRTGHPLATFDDQLQGEPMAVGDLTVLATDRGLVALDRDARAQWKKAALKSTFVAGNTTVKLPGGDVVLVNFGQIDDSGADLVRIHRDGTAVWHACPRALGVGHSEYEHFVYTELRGDKLYVISQGSYGAFLERLSVATGKRELRCVYGAEQGVANGCQHDLESCP